MATKCANPLSNPGNYCDVAIDEIRRVLFVNKYKDDGTLNYITQSNAAAIANWQTLFDKPDFSSSIMEKVVPSHQVWGLTTEQEDNVVDDNNGYLIKLADGNYTVSYEHILLEPYSVKQYKSLEEQTLAVYFVDADDRVWGKKSGVNLYPVDILGVQFSNFSPKTREAASKTMCKFRIKNATDMNELTSVTIADGDVTSDDDFYSLIDADIAISSPAVTGCVAVIDTAQGDVAVTGIAYTAFTFVDQADGSTATLAGVGSVTESPNGTYTINEAALLTTAHTYDLQVTLSGYNISVGEVVVP